MEVYIGVLISFFCCLFSSSSSSTGKKRLSWPTSTTIFSSFNYNHVSLLHKDCIVVLISPSFSSCCLFSSSSSSSSLFTGKKQLLWSTSATLLQWYGRFYCSLNLVLLLLVLILLHLHHILLLVHWKETRQSAPFLVKNATFFASLEH